jgi:hypothetical protein
VARAGQVKTAGDRLTDRVAIGVLTRSFPPSLVDGVLGRTGRVEQRTRLLPSRVVVYFVLAMCLFAGQSYEEVARLLTDGLAGMRRWNRPWRVPTSAAIWKARNRVGVEPMRELFAQVCRPVAEADTVGAFYGRWRLAALDATTFDVPDTAANEAAFGRPGSARGPQRAGFPQVRMVGLVECGTHAVFAAATGPLRTGETTLARSVLHAVGPGSLLLADRGFLGYDLWQTAAATGADLLWRVRQNIVLPAGRRLPDGSYRSELRPPTKRGRAEPAVPVRVVEYTIAGHDNVYRLITTILDPEEAPAAELAALYAQRWEFESTLDEIKTHLGGRQFVLRSQYPQGVEQEIYGFLLVHHAIRALMHQSARAGEHDPDRISFARSLRVVRRRVTDQAAFSPRQTRPRTHQHTG